MATTTCMTAAEYIALPPDDRWRELIDGVVVVNEQLAQHYWPGQDPLGKRLRVKDNQGPWLEVVGLASNGHFQLPMTQLDLADALGLTPVHINRVIQSLRRGNLLELRKYAFTLGDADDLMKLGQFDDRYLHQSSGH